MAVFTEIEPRCREPLRRGDFVEYQRRPQAVEKLVLVVTFIKPLPDPPHSDPDGAYGLTNPANLGLITLSGGTRIVNIRATSVQLVSGTLEIGLTGEGDFSIYELALGWSLQPDGSFEQQIAALDVQFSRAPVNFKAGCPTDFDCREVVPCPPAPLREPVIDYLAKDYASFRRLLIDLIPQLNPGWVERSPADMGIALLELLAFEGDNLSYFQDAVANEAYLDTVRQRASAKKHARLVDYTMHEGRNAWISARSCCRASTRRCAGRLRRPRRSSSRQICHPGVSSPTRRLRRCAYSRPRHRSTCISSTTSSSSTPGAICVAACPRVRAAPIYIAWPTATMSARRCCRFSQPGISCCWKKRSGLSAVRKPMPTPRTAR
jgi:hypothetical protein